MVPLLEVKNLVVTYYGISGKIKAVDDLSFSLEKGKWLSVVGESGSGKSTLAYALIGLVPPPGRITEGSIIFDGKNLLELNKDELKAIRGKEISMVFQDPMTSLDPLRRVSDQFIETLLEHLPISKKEALEIVKEAFDSVSLPPQTLYSYPHQLSGGQRQRVIIAMAMAMKPKLLIADEPTTALDVIVQEEIMKLLVELKKMGTSIILITHDLALAASWSDQILVMYAGKLCELGETDDIINGPLHPYTRGLLDSVPDLWSDKPVKPIPGNPPDMRFPPAGCRFNPRCPLAFEKCKKDEPKPVWKDNRIVSCFLYE